MLEIVDIQLNIDILPFMIRMVGVNLQLTRRGSVMATSQNAHRSYQTPRLTSLSPKCYQI